MTTEDCRDVEPLHSAWLDGALEPAERSTVRAHLRTCGRCREGVEGLRQTRARLRNLPVRRLPPAVYQALVALPPLVATPRASRRARRVASRAAAVAAVGAGLLAGAAFALGADPVDRPQRVVVPVDLFVADHLVRAAGGPVVMPASLESGR